MLLCVLDDGEISWASVIDTFLTVASILELIVGYGFPEPELLGMGVGATTSYLASSGTEVRVENAKEAQMMIATRIQAALSKGEDPYRVTASKIFGVSASEVTEDQRRYAKCIGFLAVYSSGGKP